MLYLRLVDVEQELERENSYYEQILNNEKEFIRITEHARNPADQRSFVIRKAINALQISRKSKAFER